LSKNVQEREHRGSGLWGLHGKAKGAHASRAREGARGQYNP
jgi:hypothetical protein